MSAETDITDLLLNAVASTTFLSNSSATMVNKAVAALEETVVIPDDSNNIASEYGVDVNKNNPFNLGIDLSTIKNNTSFDLGIIPIADSNFSDTGVMPPSFPAWPIFKFDSTPSLQSLDTIDKKITVEFPDLDLPEFSYSQISDPPEFDGEIPQISTSLDTVMTPNMDISVAKPNWVLLEDTQDVTDLDTPSPPELKSITTSFYFNTVYSEALKSFKASIENGAEGIPNLNDTITELNNWNHRFLDSSIIKIALNVISDQFNDKRKTVLSFHEELQNRLTNRINEEKERFYSAIKNRSGWDTPTAATPAVYRLVNQWVSPSTENINSQFTGKTIELSLDFFEFLGTIFNNLSLGIQELRSKEIEKILSAHQFSLGYARQVVTALLAEYEADTFTLKDVEFQKVEAQLKVVEAKLTVVTLNYELATLKVQAERARQENDGLLIQQYQIEAQQAQRDVKVFATQVAALRNELDLKKLPLDIFLAKVKAFEAKVNAHEARTQSLISDIEGDIARVQGELAKAKAFEAEARSFEEKMTGLAQKVSAQSSRNEAIIREYASLVKAKLAPIEQSLLQNKYELQKYQINADNVIADAKLALRSAEIKQDLAQKKQDGKDKAFELTQNYRVDLARVELSRLKGLAETNSRGAQYLAEMAMGAMSAANGIAAAVLNESA